MPAPFLPSDAITGTVQVGNTGLSLNGCSDLGPGVPGEGTLLMLDDPDPEVATLIDEQTIQAGHDNESVPDWDIVAVNNSAGAVYFVWQRFGDDAYSNAISATLQAAAGAGAGAGELWQEDDLTIGIPIGI